jgi:hypothetical protein
MIKNATNGKLSSEFFISMLGMVGGILCALFSDAQWVQIAGPILSAVCGASYSQARATVKKSIAGAEGLKAVREAADGAGKSES